MSHYANQPGRSPGAAGWLASLADLGARRNFAKLMAPKHSRGSVRVHMQSFGAAQNVTLC